jgi:hypothetical protein
MTTIVRLGQKRPIDAKGAGCIVESYLSNHENVLQIGRKIKLDPILLGNKMLSGGAGLDIRLAEMRYASQKSLWVEQFKYLTTGLIKVWTKQDIPANMPAPITMVFGDRPGSGDLGGPAAVATTNTSDDVHKIVTTDLSAIKANVKTAVHGEGTDARYATYSENANHVAYTPDGVWHIAFSDLNGAVENAYHAYSSDGGRTWTTERVDDSWSGRQSYCSLAVDKNGLLYLLWAEVDDADTARRFLRLRTKTSAGVFSTVEQVSDTNVHSPNNLDPCTQFKSDGVTLGITWTGQGYGGDYNGFNVMYRTRSSAGVYATQEVLTSDATHLTKEYRKPSLDYDSNDKPHIGYNWHDDAYVLNTYYTNKVGAGWLTAEQVNTDHNNAGGINSNVIVDPDNRFHICYMYDTGTQYNLIHKSRNAAGVWSAASTIEEKVYVSQMQMNIDETIMFCIPTKNYGAQYVLVSKTWPKNGTLSAATIRDDRIAAGYRILSGMTLWGSPIVHGTQFNTPQQGNIFLYTVFAAASLEHCDVVFLATSDAVIGGVNTPVITQSYVTRRRGHIAVGKKELVGTPLIM